MAKFALPVPPAPIPLSLTGAALAVNLICALMLARFRSHAGSLTRAAFLSARNDAYANVAIVLAASSPSSPCRPGPTWSSVSALPC
jgi:Co/Zn/Cd efflux system component